MRGLDEEDEDAWALVFNRFKDSQKKVRGQMNRIAEDIEKDRSDDLMRELTEYTGNCFFYALYLGPLCMSLGKVWLISLQLEWSDWSKKLQKPINKRTKLTSS